MPKKTTPISKKRAKKADVVPLSRWRASLARARVGSRLEAMLESTDAARLVPTLPVQDLYYAIQEVGLAAVHDLLMLCSPSQLRGFLDLDLWQGDRLAVSRGLEWLDALTNLGPLRLSNAVRALDCELASLFLAQQGKVYDLSLGESPPEDSKHPIIETPDTFYAIELTAEDEAGRAIERFVLDLYRADMDLARQVVMGARWELPAELEELSYRWRSGRMADMGFVDFYDALEIYRFLDPKSVRIGEGSAWAAPPRETDSDRTSGLPAPYVDPLEREGFFQRAALRLQTESEVQTLQQSLVALANRVMAAEQLSPAEIESVRAALGRTIGFLSIGLEYLAQGDLDRAVEGLRSIALVRIFRVGVSLALQLGRLASVLSRRSKDRLEPGEAEFLAALEQRPPVLHFPGQAVRSFEAVADIRQAAALLERTSFGATLLLERLGWSELRGRSADLCRTAAINLGLGRPFAPVPLSGSDDLSAFQKIGFDPAGHLRPETRAKVERAVRERIGTGAPPFLAELLGEWLARLEPELGQVSETADPRFVGGLLFEPF